MGLAVKKVLYRRQRIADFEDSWPQSLILLGRRRISGFFLLAP